MESLLNTYKGKYNLEYYDCDEKKFLEILKENYFELYPDPINCNCRDDFFPHKSNVNPVSNFFLKSQLQNCFSFKKNILPKNLDINLWKKITNFHYAFTRFTNFDCRNKNINDIVENIVLDKRPSIILTRIGVLRELMKSKNKYLVDIIFGLKCREKLLKIETNDCILFFHGLWYLFLDDCKSSNLEIVPSEEGGNNDNELVYIGVNFEQFKNEKYYMKWGSLVGDIHDQNVYLVDGLIQNTLGC